MDPQEGHHQPLFPSQTLENMRSRTAATSWWHKSLRYKEGESHFGDPLAGLVLDHLSAIAFAGVP